jgi:CheY-like chemotaxis protein
LLQSLRLKESNYDKAVLNQGQSTRNLLTSRQIHLKIPAPDTNMVLMNTTDATQSTRLHFLVAEDSLVNQALAIRILESNGHSVTVVSNGREAVEALSDDRFDVVLMDVDMPEMDGISATRAIRDRERSVGRRIPIVAVTANENRDECLRAGMDAYLPKPLRLEPLSKALLSVLGRTAA